jgi:hypothetical protein
MKFGHFSEGRKLLQINGNFMQVMMEEAYIAGFSIDE